MSPVGKETQYVMLLSQVQNLLGKFAWMNDLVRVMESEDSPLGDE